MNTHFDGPVLFGMAVAAYLAQAINAVAGVTMWAALMLSAAATGIRLYWDWTDRRNRDRHGHAEERFGWDRDDRADRGRAADDLHKGQ